MKNPLAWLAMCVCVAFAGIASAAPGAGLVLEMMETHPDMRLKSIAAVDKAPEPRSFIGTPWHVSATDPQGDGALVASLPCAPFFSRGPRRWTVLLDRDPRCRCWLARLDPRQCWRCAMDWRPR